MTLTYVVPTIGRPTLSRTLGSIVAQQQAGDELLVVGGTEAIAKTTESFGGRFIFYPPGGNWGASERNVVLEGDWVQTDYLTFLDDDDCAAPEARHAISAGTADPGSGPVIFRMAGASGVLWQTPELRMGNVGTPMFVLPNDHDHLGRWTPVYEGDFGFISSCRWPIDTYRWRFEVIALVRPS